MGKTEVGKIYFCKIEVGEPEMTQMGKSRKSEVSGSKLDRDRSGPRQKAETKRAETEVSRDRSGPKQKWAETEERRARPN